MGSGRDSFGAASIARLERMETSLSSSRLSFRRFCVKQQDYLQSKVLDWAANS